MNINTYIKNIVVDRVSDAVRLRLEKVVYHLLGDGFDAAEAWHIKKAVGVVGVSGGDCGWGGLVG